jgi:hypothetical protein
MTTNDVIRWASGDEYYGDWDEDIQAGLGTMLWASGDRYEGAFKANMFEGNPNPNPNPNPKARARIITT